MSNMFLECIDIYIIIYLSITKVVKLNFKVQILLIVASTICLSVNRCVRSSYFLETVTNYSCRSKRACIQMQSFINKVKQRTGKSKRNN